MKDFAYIKSYCIIRDDDKIIMTRDAEGQPGWKFPGGHIEKNELIMDAIKREVREEINIEIAIEGLFLIEDYFNRKRAGEHNINFYFVANKILGTPKPLIGEVAEIKSLTLQEIKDLEHYPPHRYAIEQLINGTEPINLKNIYIEKYAIK